MKQYLAIFFSILLFKISTGSPNMSEDNIYNLPDQVISGTLWEKALKYSSESIKLFDNDEISNLNGQSLEDLIEYTPNITYTAGTNAPRYYQIRGIGENSQFEGETPDQSVRFIIDEFDLTGISGAESIFDVTQIEIIRGSQIGSYGANSSAGIIKLSTQSPTEESENKLKVDFGNYNKKNVSIALGGPTDDEKKSTFYRLTLSKSSSDGFIENTEVSKKNTNKDNTLYSQFKIHHKINDNNLARASIIFTEAKSGYDEWSLQNTRHKTQSDKIGKDNQRTKGINLSFENNNNNYLLTSSSTILSSDSNYSYDSDWGNYSNNTSGYDGYLSTNRNRKSISQEVRLDSFGIRPNDFFDKKWTIGMNFSQIREISDIRYDETYNASTEIAEVYSNYIANTISLFGKLNFILNNNENLTFGYRFENQFIDFLSEIKNNNSYYGSLGSGSVSSQDPLLGGSIVYSKLLSDNNNLYISYNRGYRSGGVNSSTFRQNNSPLSYKTEYIDAYEIGLNFKNSSNSYIGSINAFFLERKNPQVRDSQGSGGFFNYFTSNSDRATHYGLEYQSKFKIDEIWSFSTNFSLLKTNLKETDRELPNSPSDQYSFLISCNPKNGFYSNVSLSISDGYYESNSHNYKRDSYTIWKGSAGYVIGNFDVSLWMNNIFDESYSKRVFYFNNADPNSPNIEQRYLIEGDPRNFGISLEYTW